MLSRIVSPSLVVLIGCWFGVTLAPTATAQTGAITGTVLDESTNAPIPGANVFVLGTEVGSITDADGRFNIPAVPTGEWAVRASFIGYTAAEQRVTVRDGETHTVNFVLPPGVLLEGLVVTALGIERAERSLGYSAQALAGDDLARVPQQNFMSGLQGRVAGATFNTSNSMGGSTRIVLRGVRSLAGNNEPLIVIDGVILDNSNYVSAAITRPGTARTPLAGAPQTRGVGGRDYGNAAQFINADDIESVTVLQGSTAAALYGSRAANGVIQIVTKSGRHQPGVGIQVNSNLMASSVYALPNYQNLYGGGSFRPMLTTDGDFILGPGEHYFADYGTDESWGPRLDGRLVRQWYSFDDVDGLLGVATPWVAEPNNVRDFFETGLNQNHNIAFTHAGETFNYRLSYTHHNVSDVFPNATLQRNQFGLNGGANLSPRLRVNAVANYVASDAHNRPGTGYDGQNVFQQFNHFGQRNLDLRPNGPMANIFRADGTQRGWNWRNRTCADPSAACPQGRLIYFDNPYWVQHQNAPRDDMRRFFGTSSLGYELTSDLRVVGEVRTDQFTDRREQRLATHSQPVSGYLEEIRQVQENSVASRLHYDRNVTQDVSLTGFLGADYSYRRFNLNAGRTQGGLVAANVFTLENSTARPEIVDYFEERGTIGAFAEATVGYRDMVYLSGTLRNDWVSTLPEGDNRYIYPSFTAAFVFSDLAPLQNQDILSFGKLRFGLAQTGNDTDPYRTTLVYPVLSPFEGSGVQTLPGSLNNPDLLPERTTEYTAGLELQLIQNRLGLDFTVYHEVSEDQILPVAVSRTSGFSTLVLNTGRIDNSGFTLALNATPLMLGDFRWDFNANVARNRNEVVSLNEELDLQNYVIGTPPFGPQIVARVGEAYGAMFGTAFLRDTAGNIIIGPNGLPRTDPVRQVVGNYVPDAVYGFGTTFSFRNISANVLLSGQIGGDIFSVSNLFGLYSGILEETVAGDIREVGLVPVGVDDNGNPWTGRVDAEAFFKGMFGTHEAHIYDATHLRVQEVAISYTIPQRFFGTAPVQGVTLSAIGRNLGVLYKRTPHFDPAEAVSATNLQGFEAGQVPPQRSLGLSVQFSF
jgi:TonB-linked SusC/RagA family outer membrane protein